ncbi:MAG: PEP-CTERM sorting domain-containing protein [Phycisphaerales bacterium]|nr:PEP-CTERM sorting domain-containing protein [Phycisphaerales bacterium]MCB9863415.1 PEP-CTERM sorting domain-containing protein [Phycisphaerales bacterium]
MFARRRLAATLMIAVVLAANARAGAVDLGVGSLARNLFRGSEYAGNPQFLSQPQNGPLFNFNAFTQRLEYNRAGDGYTYEFYRFFGGDTYGNQTFLDLGPLNVELFPDPNLGQTQFAGLHGRAGFTTRFIPEVFFETQTGERTLTQNFSNGTSVFNVAPIGYTVSFNAGVQDFQWTGNLLVDSSISINALGFYDADIRIANRGGATADGVVLSDSQVTDFDTGPINVSGNLVLDAIGSLFQANGNPATSAPFQIGSGAAQRQVAVDELLAKVDAGEGLTDEEVQMLVQEMFITAFLNDPLGTVQNGLPSTVPGFEGLGLELAGASDSTTVQTGDSQTVPEPGMLLLFGVAGAIGYVRRNGRAKYRTA